jgi:hypothetical protein
MRSGVPGGNSPGLGPNYPAFGEPETTERLLAVSRSGATDEGIRLLQQKAGLEVARSADFSAGDLESRAAGATVLGDLEVVLISADPAQRQALAALADGGSMPVVEPERLVYALEDGSAAVRRGPEGQMHTEECDGVGVSVTCAGIRARARERQSQP